MRIVLFSHPAFMRSQSMPRFAEMLRSAYQARGHHVEVWSPVARIFNLAPDGRLSKWAGYVDQHILFPIHARMILKKRKPDTLYVFCDQALGPWVPLVRNLPHVIHVHDLLALRSALGEFPENSTSITGKIYQRLIRSGFRRGRHFISVSNKTRDDLHKFGQVSPVISEVVYNGLNYDYFPLPPAESVKILQAANLPHFDDGILLHVGGGQWYKNLPGVIALYARYAALQERPLPLWCVGPNPGRRVRSMLEKVPANGRVLFLQNVENRTLQALYSSARAFLFPSLEEGFGWPLVEAQACGCPVITTNEAPMTEIAGDSAVYLPRLRAGADEQAWAAGGAVALTALLSEDTTKRDARIRRGYEWVKRFNADSAIEAYIAVYHRVMEAAIAPKKIGCSAAEIKKI